MAHSNVNHLGRISLTLLQIMRAAANYLWQAVVITQGNPKSNSVKVYQRVSELSRPNRGCMGISEVKGTAGVRYPRM
jgi:hypothetical protein